MQRLHFFMKPRHTLRETFGINLRTLLDSCKSKSVAYVSSSTSSVSPERAMSHCGRAWIKFGQTKKVN
jgi:hypothetical protein